MTYRALVYFEDLQDNGHPYQEGDIFPRPGFTPSARRIAELASAKNKRGMAVIEAIKPEEPPTIEPEQDFMNKPVEAELEAGTHEEDVRPKRGRRRKAER